MKKNLKKYGWIIPISLLLVTIYILAAYNRIPGQFVAPLDDAYIHFQYARQIANGLPWQYNSGDALSTGATSMLYPFILAVGLLAGVADENLALYALSLGVVALILSAVFISLITRQLLELTGPHKQKVIRVAPLLAALLFLLSGAVQWGYFNGMETGLFALLLLAALHAFLARRFVLAGATIFLASLARPEALFMTAIFWLIIGFDWWRGDDRKARLSMLIAPTAFLMLSLIPVAFNYTLTGAALATGAQAKSWFLNVPFRFSDILTSIGRDFLKILQRLSFGFLASSTWPLIPLLLPATLLGWVVLWYREQYAVFGLTFGWFLAGALSTATLITAIWQQGRYQIPFVALLLPIAVVGGVSLLEILPGRMSRLAGIASVGLFIMLSVWQSILSVDSYAQSAYSIANQQIAIAKWIDENLPERSRIGVHDPGVIRYIGNRPTFDMIGLTSQGTATAWRQGMGAVFERMENAEDRPSYFATYPDIFSIPYLQETDLFLDELFRVNLQDFSPFSSAGPAQAVYRADWRLANSGNAMYQSDMLRLTEQMKLVDSIDVADLGNERNHNLVWSEGPVVPGFPTEVRQLRYRTEPTQEVLDGGRLLTGGIEFKAAVAPGMDLILVGRIHAQDSVSADVIVNGEFVGSWRYPSLPGEWLESAFQIPSEYVDSNPLKIEIILSDQNAPDTKFEPYYFWLWQGESNPDQPAPEYQTNSLFEGGLELIGYDLESSHYKPGEKAPLVLYWRSNGWSDLDAVVFIHLYDESGELVAQLDQRSYLGTRPPYTWNPHEILIDPQTLELPSDLTDGQFQLAVGLYDPLTLARFTIKETIQRELPDNRLFLQTLTIDAE